jgi:diguanylate cyclase (GGDEF)-like protein
MDLDRFKIVNDSYGHHIGDDVLCHAALAIQSCVREVDTVARVGGDEFAVLIEENERKSFAVRVAQRIRNALCTPFDIRDQVINIGVSIGIVLKAERYELPEEILRDADIAMYKAKAERGIRCRVFNRKMRDGSAESLFFEKDLLKGLESKEFFLDYQPMVHMDSGRLYGFEALVRWNRQGEILTPAYFLPIAEDTGNIGKLGLHIIEEVSRQMVEWKKQCSRSFAIHMNISGRQLHCPMFSREVRRILERTGVDPSCLFFEITEDVVLNSGGDCIRSIKRIRDLGVRFCLDNFGTGLSSLNYLRQLPLSCIKVDKSFILNVDTDPDSLVIVRNLLSLGQDLGLSVIAEGVEREQQVEALLSVGYALAQGYYFSYPLAVGKAGAFLSG